MLVSIGLIFLVAGARRVEAAAYYVSASNGNDGNPGTMEQPWKTITKAVGSLQPGDTVLVRGGIYRESVPIRVSGTAAARITIKAYPGETPVLEGTMAVQGWTHCVANEPGLTVKGTANQYSTNIYKAQVPAGATTKVEYVMMFENSELLQLAQFPSQANPVYDDVEQYLSLTDSRNWGQSYSLWDPVQLNQPDDYWNGAKISIWSHAANNVTLMKTITDFVQSEGKIVFDSALSANLTNTGSQPDAYSILNHPHALDKPGEFYVAPTVVDNQRTIYLWPREAAHLEQSIAISTYGVGFLFASGAGNYVTVDGFEIRGYAGDENGWTGGVIYPHMTGHAGVVVQNCRIINNRGKAGIWVDSGSGDVVKDNEVRNVQGGFGIFFTNSTHGTVAGNSISDTTRTCIYMPGCTQCRIVGNRVGGGGVHANGVAIYQGSSDMLVANNIVTNASHPFTLNNVSNLTLFNNVFAGTGGYAVADWGGCTGTIALLNNVILGAPEGKASLLLTSTGLRYIIKNNVIGGGGGGERSNNIYTSLCWDQDARYGWSPASGESINRNLSALFVDPANYDYRLAAGSPAINAGTAVDAYLPKALFPDFDFSRDIAGTVRDAVPDIGPYEYGSGTPTNRAPVLEPVGNRTVAVNTQLSFTVRASDPEGDPLTFSANNLPAGATFVNQVFTWTPAAGQIGSYQVTFIVSDGKAQASETITIVVERPNTAPVLAPIGSKATSENSPLSFSISATDAEGDPITYSANSLPNGASFVGQIFSWTPTYSQAGSYNVTFTASDGQAQSTQAVAISVANINRTPALAAIGDKSVDESNTLTFGVSGIDPDGDGLTYSASGLPTGANFTGQTFTWTPAAGQSGSYEITFVANDGELTASETISVMVVSVQLDKAAPVVARQSPAPDAIQIALNNLLTLHITDAGTGVDANSVVIAVNDTVIYQGNKDTYTIPYGQCSRSGSKNDYRFIYQNNKMFDFDHEVTVRVAAADFAGNVMPEYTYSFMTEMRSFSGNKQVSKSTGPANKRGAVTISDAAGNIWAAWHAGPENARDIYVAKLTAGADAFGAPIRLTTDSRDQCNPDLAVAPDGSLYVVWQDNRQGNWDIYVSIASGDRFSKEMQITNSSKNETNPAIVIDRQSPGYAHVAWQDDRNGNQDIYVASSANAFASSTVARVTNDAANQTQPDIAVDAQNTVYIVWTDMRNGQADICGAASNNGPWTNVPIVTSAGNQTDPALVAEPGGSVLHLVWVDSSTGDRDIYYAKLDGLPSSPVTGSSIIDDTSGADQIVPTVVCNGFGQVFACWQDSRHVGAYSADSDLYFAELSEGTVRANVLVGDDGTNTNQSEPALGVDRYNEPYIVWSDDRTSAPEIYFAAATFIDPSPLDSKVVIASAGAIIGTEPTAIKDLDDVSIAVPPQACQADVRMMISKIINPPVSTVACLGSYDFGPSGIDFDQPVTVTVPYRLSGGTRARAYWYNSMTGALSQQGITDVESITLASGLSALRFKTTHFTPFYVMAGDAGSTTTGGGGGGCSISPTGDGSPGQLLVPYAIIALVMIFLKRKDRRKVPVTAKA